MSYLPSRRGLLSRRMWLWVWIPIVMITVLHYGAATGEHLHWVHDVARRLYYLPIIGAAFVHGARCSIPTAFVVLLLYIPHAFLGFPMTDPARGLEKSLEMVVYIAVAIVTGVLVDRERAERKKQMLLTGRLKRALEERERIADQLIRSGRLTALGELTAGIAHEIRNPLHALRGTAEILGDDLPAAGDSRDMLERHIAEIDRLSRVLDRFLAFAQPSKPALVSLDPAVVLRRAVGLVSAQARRDGVEVQLVSVEEGARVEGDLDLLVQVCVGIALNAVQSLKEAGQEGKIEVSGKLIQRRGEGVYVLRWSNSGPPIPEEHLERIFDPFFTTRTKGAGLGLSIGSRIVDMHGGEIVAKNEGSPPLRPVFEIRLPLQQV